MNKEADTLRNKFLSRIQHDNNLRRDASQVLSKFAETGDIGYAEQYQRKLIVLRDAEAETREIERKFREALG